MKYLFLALLLFGCADQDKCEFGNGSKAFLGQPLTQCAPKSVPRTLTSAWEKKHDKGCKYLIPGRFKISNNKNGYYNCTGIITNYPILSDSGVWTYSFNRLRCGKHWDDSDTAFIQEFKEDDIKRTGNLGD